MLDFMSSENILYSAFIEERPCVLLLGQDAWTTPDRGDPILELFIDRLGGQRSAARGWREVLTSPLNPADFEWLTERFERNVVPESVQDVLDLGWSAVFTSSIDPQIIRRLESRGRQPEAIVSVEQYPRVARSKSRPPVYFLFGRANETSESTRCPSSSNELTRREIRQTLLLLARAPETVTSVGLLVVDGLMLDRDWLRLDTLLGALPLGEGMRVLWFGADARLNNSTLFRELCETGTVIPDERRLPHVVARMKASGRLAPAATRVLHEPGIISLSDDSFIDFSPSLRLRVEASAAIVDDEWTQPPLPLDAAVEEEAFRRFHGELGGARILVEGVARGFAIKRPFEDTLREHVQKALEKPADIERLVVVHGQSGTGKTIALARLAYLFRTEFQVPVLFAIERPPEPSDVEAFCREAERQGASTTLVLCDANQLPERYFALSGSLRSKGRRVVIVGTSYRTERKQRSVLMIEAPTQVTTTEREQIVALMRRFDKRFDTSQLDAPAEAEYVLALLYRMISAGRQRLISGVSREARATEDVLRERSRRPHRKYSASQLAQQLVAAGLHDGMISMFEEDAPGDESFGHDAPGRLIDYIMVAGCLDTYVPLNLLMRVLRAQEPKIDFTQIAELFDELDLFRWRYGNEEKTELLVGPRLRFEANLICRRRLADPAREIDCLVDLICGVRSRSVDLYSELRFLSELLQKLDHDGPRGRAYEAGYLRIGQALTKLRLHHGVEDASIMLQESNFRRAWLRAMRAETGLSTDERDCVLNEARSVVEEAIAKIDTGHIRAARRTRQNLYVERASIYGFLAVGHASMNAPSDEVWSDYLAARTATRKAMSVAPNYFPYDVALWTPADILDNQQSAVTTLSPAQRSELVADIYAVLDQIDPEQLPPSQVEKYQDRRRRLGDSLKDEALKADARKELESISPAVAIYLDAREMCPEIFKRGMTTFSAAIRDKARKGVLFLRKNSAAITGDIRGLRLLLEFEWTSVTGERLLRGERRPLPYDPAHRSELLQVLRDLHAASGDTLEFPLRYLEAVLAWVSSDIQYAMEVWRALARDTEFEDRWRVYRRLFVADADCKPVLHRGRLVADRGNGHWQLEVENVSGRVDLLERDFRDLILKKGYEVRDFVIAFNYLGPVADPLARYEVKR